MVRTLLPFLHAFFKSWIEIILLLSSINICLGQFSKGFLFETSLTGDYVFNSFGGIGRDVAYIGMEELSLTFNFDEMGYWNGGMLYVQGLNTHGSTPSVDFIGDIQITSNIESGYLTGIYQYYYRQKFGKTSFIIGKHDLNSEFSVSEYSGTFINSSFGISPTISLNVPVSIYPLTALGLNYHYEASDNLTLKLGAYDGNPINPEMNRYDVRPTIDRKEGLLLIGEIGLSRLLDNNLPENIKLCGYYHSAEFMDFSDTTLMVKGNYGFYFLSDFVLFHSDANNRSSIRGFLQGGYAPAAINQVDYYVGAGIDFNGFIRSRQDDVFGIAVAYANISKQYKRSGNYTNFGEKTIELTYQLNLMENFLIQPNFQYIINPGANRDLNNAFVKSIRLAVQLDNQ